jgi:hypothetical protein
MNDGRTRMRGYYGRVKNREEKRYGRRKEMKKEG